MEDIIIIVILAVVLGLAALYIYKQKKKGSKCIGCPYAKSGSCNCSCNQK